MLEYKRYIAIDVINDVRRLCTGDAPSPALFFFKVRFFENDNNFEKGQFVHEIELPTLRVWRPVTRLTVHWAL